MIRVRVDDYPHTSRREPQHTPEAFREFHRVLSECIGGRRYLLGVVPRQCDPDDLLLLRNETDVVVGMHGTDHDEERLTRNGGNQFEPYLTGQDVQRTLFEHRAALEMAVGRPIRIYMPPRNVIDWRTAIAMSGAGFDYYTGGPETPNDLRNTGSCILSLPPYEYGRTDELFSCGAHDELVNDSEAYLGRGSVVLTLHWTWETNIGLHHMRRFFDRIHVEHFADFDA